MGKKSVLLLQEFEAVFSELETDAERSTLIMALFAYAFHGEEPELTGILRYAWRTHIKPKLDEMDANYERKCNSLRENAKKRWEKGSDAKGLNDMQKDANVCKPMQKNADAYDKDKDKDKDKDIYNNNYSESTSSEPVDTVDNSPKSVDNSNAQPGPDNSRPKSLDGMDLYSLPGKDAFAIFREEYPRHQGALREVQTAWVTAVAGGALPGDLVMAGRKYARVCSEEHTEQKYIKMPQNFIGSGLWKQYAPKYLPSCPHCHGAGVYQGENGMIMCECNRRYG